MLVAGAVPTVIRVQVIIIVVGSRAVVCFIDCVVVGVVTSLFAV